MAYSGVILPPHVEPEPIAPTVTIVGRLAPWKGQHILLDAATRVRREVPDARFRIVGDALFGEEDYRRACEEQTVRSGLAEAVEFRGFREDVGADLAASTLVVHASTLPEPFGQTVVEAMAAGRAVIAADAGGPRETVVHGETGLLTPPGDAEALAAAIVRLLKDPAERRAMAEAGRRRVAEHFTIEQTAETVTAFIEQVVEMKGRRGRNQMEQAREVSAV